MVMSAEPTTGLASYTSRTGWLKNCLPSSAGAEVRAITDA